MCLKQVLIYPRGTTDACAYAAEFLKQAGFFLTDHPSQEVTHLLLDVPSFAPDGSLRGGGAPDRILEMLPPAAVVIGGNLKHPALAEHRVLDLLQDPDYLAYNAAITAECALQIAASVLPAVFSDSPALIIGWGRIGKCLSKLLTGLGCPVTIAARNSNDRAVIRGLGWQAADIDQIPGLLSEMRLIFNTVPVPILSPGVLDGWGNCVKIDLASRPGLDGKDVIYARGLPGRYAPESSGRLIARTIACYLREETL